MKKVALVFVLAVLVPSLLLAWLAVRSLRDQQFLLERQQSLLDQHVTDALAQDISDYLAQRQQEFGAQVESMAASSDPQTLATKFDDELRQHWPLAEVGFCVTAAGKILSPLPNARPAAQMFRLDNSSFLGNREPVEVYLTANNGNANGNFNNANNANNELNNGTTLHFGRGQVNQSSLALNNPSAQPPAIQRQESQSVAQVQSRSTSSAPQPTTASASPRGNVGSFGGAGGGGGAGFGGGNATLFGQTTSMPPVTIASSFANSSLPATRQQLAPGGVNDGIENGRNGFFISPSDQTSIRNTRRSQPVGQSQAFAINNAMNVNPAADGIVALGRGDTADRTASAAVPPPAETAQAKSVQTVAPQSPVLAENKDENVPAPESNPLPQQPPLPASDESIPQNAAPTPPASQNNLNYKSAVARKVSPLSQKYLTPDKTTAESSADDAQENLSKVVPAEAEFRQLIGDQTDGMLARFLQNKLKLMCWHRLNTQPDLIFGAQLNLDRVVDGLRNLVKANRSSSDEICLAVLDDNARPIVVSRGQFQANWKRPFVATEVGDALPHWEVAAYLVNPAQLSQAAQTTKLTLGLLIAVLVVAIGIGSLLIVRGLQNELRLARQKTDFVSNVSHELKTPLTSIRMFSELLAEGRVSDPARQHSYLQIITAEAGRLTRLINNVLDFSRMERGEKKYNFQPCDLTDIVRATAETFRPHLESSGFQFNCELPAAATSVRGDSDALSQIIVNLLSNAEKYSAGVQAGVQALACPPNDLKPKSQSNEPGQETGAPRKEITLQLAQKQAPLPHAEIKVLDCGPGVPRGSEEKIFEQFYRAHDSLSSGIQGSGLGLTIARQIARAHGGDVVYEPRPGGGSCFIVRLPVQTS